MPAASDPVGPVDLPRTWRPMGGADRAVHSVRWQSRQVTPMGVAASAPNPGRSWV